MANDYPDLVKISTSSKYTLRFTSSLGGTDSSTRSVTGLNFGNNAGEGGTGPQMDYGITNFLAYFMPFTQGQLSNIRIVQERNVSLA